MKIYISGKISGLDINAARKKFKEAENHLRTNGFVPINPTENGLSAESDWKHHMVKDIELLFGCDAIYMLSNWNDSIGACIEYDIAKRLNLTIIHE